MKKVIYLISDGYYIKIGKTTHRNVKKRLGKIQTGNARKLELLKIYEDNNDSEKELHELFNNYRMCGEWFNIDLSFFENKISSNDKIDITEISYNKNVLKNQKAKPVMCITTKNKYKSITEASKKTGIDRSLISRVCLGLRKHANKTEWKYLNILIIFIIFTTK